MPGAGGKADRHGDAAQVRVACAQAQLRDAAAQFLSLGECVLGGGGEHQQAQGLAMGVERHARVWAGAAGRGSSGSGPCAAACAATLFLLRLGRMDISIQVSPGDMPHPKNLGQVRSRWPQVLPISLHTMVSGVLHRLHALREALVCIRAHPRARLAHPPRRDRGVLRDAAQGHRGGECLGSPPSARREHTLATRSGRRPSRRTRPTGSCSPPASR